MLNGNAPHVPSAYIRSSNYDNNTNPMAKTKNNKAPALSAGGKSYRKKKERCPECSFHTIGIDAPNMEMIIDMQGQYRKRKMPVRSVEEIANKIFRQYRIFILKPENREILTQGQ